MFYYIIPVLFLTTSSDVIHEGRKYCSSHISPYFRLFPIFFTETYRISFLFTCGNYVLLTSFVLFNPFCQHFPTVKYLCS